MVTRQTLETPASLDERLAARRAALSPGEQRVAEFFAAHREEAAFLSATKIAAWLGTSDATVVRAAQALGYAGLGELKREISAALRARMSPALSLERRLAASGTDPDATLTHALGLQIELLQEARQTVRPAAFAAALDLLHASDRVLIFGSGPSAALAGYLALRLTRIGRQAGAITATGVALADELLVVRPGDVLLLMAYGRVYREAVVTLDRAREQGVPVVLLTDTLAAALADWVAVSLSARRGRAGALGSIATTLVLMDALLLGLAARDQERALHALRALNDLRARLVEGNDEGNTTTATGDDNAA